MTFSLKYSLGQRGMFWVTVLWTAWIWSLNEFHVLKMELDSVGRDLREGLASPEREVGRPLLFPHPHSWGWPHCPAGVKGKVNTQTFVHLTIFAGKPHEAPGAVTWFHCDSSLSCLSITFLRCWFCARGHKLLAQLCRDRTDVSCPQLTLYTVGGFREMYKKCHDSMHSCVALQGWFSIL